jgi:hypothetical protein
LKQEERDATVSFATTTGNAVRLVAPLDLAFDWASQPHDVCRGLTPIVLGRDKTRELKVFEFESSIGKAPNTLGGTCHSAEKLLNGKAEPVK